MIALLRGTLVDKNPNRLIVDAGGVGYDVQVPLSTFYVIGEAGTGARARRLTVMRRGNDVRMRMQAYLLPGQARCFAVERGGARRGGAPR